MAFYSVWDWDRNAWAIYATQRPASVGDDPIPPRPRSTNPIGCDPDTDVKALPAGAKLIGYAHMPRGEVRRLAGSWGDVGDDAGANGSGGSFWTRPIVMFAAGAATAVVIAKLIR